MVTGSYDYEVRFWDFNAMDTRMKPFRVLEPWDGNQVLAL